MAASGLRVVVAGTGFGCRIQIPALRAAGFEVVGLVGADAARTKQRAADNGVPSASTDLGQAIAQTGATAVAISTPPDAHAPLVLTALRQGCHVLCEKPFALNVAEAKAMRDAAKTAGRVCLIGHEFRMVPERAMVSRLIGEGVLGEPKFLAFIQFTQYTSDPNVKVPAWWFDLQSGGGWLGASGSHMVDGIRNWLGDFDSLSAVLPHIAASPAGAEDSFVVRFRLANGAEGTLQQTSAAHGHAQIIRMSGTKGTLWLDGNAIWLADSQGSRQIPIAPDLALPPMPPPSTDPRQQGMEWQMLTSHELAPYTQLCLAFRDAIDGRTSSVKAKPATFDDGLAEMQVLEAIRASAAKSGALVTVARG